MKYIFTTLCLVLLISCCGSKEATKTTNTTPPMGTFDVIELTGTDLGMVKPTIVLQKESQKISGFAGCNQYFGSLAMNEDSFKMSGLSTTKMACIQGTEEERKFMEALAKVNKYTFKNGELILYNDKDILVKAQNTSM